MDNKTRIRVLTAVFALPMLAGDLSVMASGGTAVSVLAGAAFWTGACLLTALFVYRVISGLESRRLQQ